MKSLKIYPLLFALFFLAGCGIPQEEYDKLKETNDSLQNTIEEQSSENYNLQQKVIRFEKKEREQIKKQNAQPYISEAKAIEYLDRDYSFYNRGYVYKDLKVLRIGPNKFKFSMRECRTSDTDNDFFHVDQVRTLTVFKDGKYNLTQKIYY